MMCGDVMWFHVMHFVVDAADVRDDSQHTRFINKVQSIVGNHGVNLLINNAGIFDKTIPSLTQITKDSLMSHYEVNVVAPILLTKVDEIEV